MPPPLAPMSWRHRLLAMLVGIGPITGTLAEVVPWSGAANAPVPHVRGVGAVEVVDIVAPNPAGVSMNRFDRFDVGPVGVVLNNSPRGADSVLAGALPPNAALADGAARLIINEVVSLHPSQLGGALEVAGPGAEMIVVNPSGIICNGCGFINTRRAMLTTGRPQLDAGGAFHGLHIDRGEILIANQGMRTFPGSAPELELYARQILVEGPVNVERFKAVAGPSVIDPAIEWYVPRIDTSGAPAIAIDLSGASMLRARQVTLVATGRGAGIHALGSIDTGQLRVGAGGDLVLAGLMNVQVSRWTGANIAQEYAVQGVDQSWAHSAFESIGASTAPAHATHAHVEAKSIDARAAAISVRNGSLSLQARDGGLYSESLTMDVERALDVRVTGDIVHNGGGWHSETFTARGAGFINTGGVLTADAGVDIRVDHFRNEGATIHARDLRIDAVGLDNRGGTLDAAHSLALTANRIDNGPGAPARQDMREAEVSRGTQDLNLSTSTRPLWEVIGTSEGMASQSRHHLTGPIAMPASGGLAQGGGIRSGGALVVHARHVANVEGTLHGRQSLRLHARGPVDNRGGAIESSDAEVLIDADGTLHNSYGQIMAREAVVVRAPSGLRNDGGLIASTHASVRLDLSASNASGRFGMGSLSNRDTRDAQAGITAPRDVDIVAAELDNTRGAMHGDRVEIHATELHNAGGEIQSSGALTAMFDTLRNAGGILDAGSDLALRGGEVSRGAGTLRAAGDVRMAVAGIDIDKPSAVEAGGALHVVAENVDNAGSITAGDDLLIQASRRVRNDGAWLESLGGKLELDLGRGGNLWNARAGAQGGVIKSAGSMRVACGVLDNAGSTLRAGGSMELAVRGALKNDDGVLRAGSVLRADADGACKNANGLVLAPNEIWLRTGGPIDNRAGQIRNVRPGDAVDAAGLVRVETGSMAFGNGRAGDGPGGALESTGTLTLSVGDLDNRGGRISGAQLAIDAEDMHNAGGQVQADEGALTLHANSLDNREGTMRSAQAQTLELRAGGQNDQGTVRAGEGPLWIRVGRGRFDTGAGVLDAGPGGVQVGLPASPDRY